VEEPLIRFRVLLSTQTKEQKNKKRVGSRTRQVFCNAWYSAIDISFCSSLWFKLCIC